MTGTPNGNRRGQLALIAFGLVALIFIVAAIFNNLNIWWQNDAFDARQAQEASETTP